MVKLKNQSTQENFGSLNPFLDSKSFWKSCKPYFFSKHSFDDSKIALNKGGEILTKKMKIAKTFNSYFESVTDSLELFNWPLKSNVSCNKVKNIIKSFSNLRSIIKIKHKFKLNKNSLSSVFLRLLLEKLWKACPQIKQQLERFQ